jgi:hypothetical protein
MIYKLKQNHFEKMSPKLKRLKTSNEISDYRDYVKGRFVSSSTEDMMKWRLSHLKKWLDGEQSLYLQIKSLDLIGLSVQSTKDRNWMDTWLEIYKSRGKNIPTINKRATEKECKCARVMYNFKERYHAENQSRKLPLTVVYDIALTNPSTISEKPKRKKGDLNWLEEYVEFVEENGRAPTQKDNLSLWNWKQYTKRRVNNDRGSINPDIIDELVKIHPNLLTMRIKMKNRSDAEWLKLYSKFYKKHGFAPRNNKNDIEEWRMQNWKRSFKTKIKKKRSVDPVILSKMQKYHPNFFTV